MLSTPTTRIPKYSAKNRETCEPSSPAAPVTRAVFPTPIPSSTRRGSFGHPWWFASCSRTTYPFSASPSPSTPILTDVVPDSFITLFARASSSSAISARSTSQPAQPPQCTSASSFPAVYPSSRPDRGPPLSSSPSGRPRPTARARTAGRPSGPAAGMAWRAGATTAEF